MPAPQVAVVQLEPAGNGMALATSAARTCAADNPGETASMSEMTPAKTGADALVPSSTHCASATGTVVPVLHSEKMPPVCSGASPPGALIVTPAPKLLYEARLPSLLVAATAMTPAQFAGSELATSPASLPAATVIARVTPCARTAVIA